MALDLQGTSQSRGSGRQDWLSMWTHWHRGSQSKGGVLRRDLVCRGGKWNPLKGAPGPRGRRVLPGSSGQEGYPGSLCPLGPWSTDLLSSPLQDSCHGPSNHNWVSGGRRWDMASYLCHPYQEANALPDHPSASVYFSLRSLASWLPPAQEKVGKQVFIWVHFLSSKIQILLVRKEGVCDIGQAMSTEFAP